MSDISITVSGPELGTASVSDISISYGINEIPTAMLSVSPETAGFFCNIEANRRKEVNIAIRTKQGCINFKGLLDGISSTTQKGNIRYTAVIKSYYQLLAETSMMAVGISPMGLPALTRQSAIKYSADDAKNMLYTVYGEPFIPDNYESPIEAYVEMIKLILQNRESMLNKLTLEGVDSTAIYKALDDERFKAIAEQGLALLETIDFTYMKMANSKAILSTDIMSMLLTLITTAEDNLMSVLMAGLDAMGCYIIFGNTKAFIVPANHFIQLETPGWPSTGQSSSQINVAYPADYEGFNYNDTGFVNVNQCFINTGLSDNPTVFISTGLGYYSDQNAKLGALYIKEPTPFERLMFINGMHQINREALQPFINNTKFDPSTDYNGFIQILVDGNVILEQANEAISNDTYAFDSLAKLEYLKVKYQNRTGDISLNFTPNWVPGSGGIICCRVPSVYIYCYVNSVKHSFSTTPQGGGSAYTAVSFDSAQFGAEATDASAIFYEYSKKEMTEYQQAFYNNISN